MRKIPTLFVRSEDRRSLLPEVTPGCEWVLAGEGRATRKYDGTCVLIRRDGLAVHGYARREVKPGAATPPNFHLVDHDPVTGKKQGWEPIEQSSWRKMFEEAVLLLGDDEVLVPGTYELCGPKINGNPEKFDRHRLVEHATARRVQSAELVAGPPEKALAMATALLIGLHGVAGWEGIVWHHPDGRMAKMKYRDIAKETL